MNEWMNEDDSANMETGEEATVYSQFCLSVSVGGVNSAFSVFIFILSIVLWHLCVSYLVPVDVPWIRWLSK